VNAVVHDDSRRSATADRSGLTSAEATLRLAEQGPNDPAPHKHRSRAREILRLFTNPLVLILLFAAVTSAAMRELVQGLLIIVIVLASATINFVQTFRSERTIARLSARLAYTAAVLRDGSWVEIPSREVVLGDQIRLAAGDLVPADAIVLTARDLHVHEAALTGESLPAEKEAAALDDPDPPASQRVQLGTSVVSGTATATVVATGGATAFGAIATRLRLRPPETEFDRGLRQFGNLISRAVVLLVLFVVVVSAAFHRDVLDSLLFAIALAVGLTPEFLPMITSVTLARGAARMAKKDVLVRHLSAIQNLGSIDVLLSDKTGTLTTGEMALDGATDALGGEGKEALLLAYVNGRCESGIRSALDVALLACTAPPGAEAFTKRDEVPFDFERRRVTVIADGPDGCTLVTKGAPEAVLPICTSIASTGGVVAMTDELRAQVVRTYETSSAHGLRVLAIATRRVEQRSSYHVADEHELVLAGFVAFSDPPMPDAHAALADLAADGVRVKVLTGDNERVAEHVCARVGLTVSRTVLGSEIDRLDDAALGHVVEQADLFARVTPAQKGRILLALKRRGHAVGFLGDGINDAPSLHLADVGISVAAATDVAREAADVVLLERNLRVLHNGIREGRRAFGNVMKYLLMGTSSNFGNMFSMAGAVLFLPFLPMLPIQILLNNLLYDGAQLTIPTDRVDDSYMRRPQRWDLRFVRNFMLLVGPVSSIYDFVTFYVLLHVFRATATTFQTGWFVESIATQSLVLFVIRTSENPLRSRPSVALTATTLAAVLIGVVLPFSPLASVLGFTPLPARFFAFLVAIVVGYLLLVQLLKRWLITHALKGSGTPVS
jgi:Mg2+-importing ATPase